MKQRLVMRKEHWQAMRDHVEEHAPLEACGLLAGRSDQAELVIPVRNRAQSRVRFVMDPYEQIEAFERIESAGLELLAIFHSHPAGPETVSATDIAEAAYEVVHLIWSRVRGEWQARGFWIEGGTAREVSLQIADESNQSNLIVFH